MKKILFGVLSVFSVACLVVFVAACRKEIPEKNDYMQGAKEVQLPYSKTIVLYDGSYFIEAQVSSSSQTGLDDAMNLQPAIRVISDTGIVSTGSVAMQYNIDSDVVHDSIQVKLTAKRNVPDGYVVEQYFAKSANTVQARAVGYYYFSFQDDVAIGVTTTVRGSYKIPHKYESRGCCWYSWGWYDRGSIMHYGPNYSYPFDATKYTSSRGVRVWFSTTNEAAASTSRSYRY